MDHELEPQPAEGEPSKRRRALRVFSGVAAVLMLWSVIGAPASHGQDQEVVEPESITAYATLADAMPVQSYFDHQTYQIPLGPAIAHSQTEVNLPSEASAISWLVDNGIANGLSGTTTGNKVPTEASAKQPGGDAQEEFKTTGGPIGNDSLMRVEGGRAFASAEHSDQPQAYGNAYLHDLVVLPAAGSPNAPPGTFNPDARYPGGPNETDPAPQGQMAVLAIGSIASTSQSFRDNDTVTSIAVADLKDINIGNRTSDNRCTNCIRIDSIRAEAFAQANGTVGGSRAAYRVILGRACRRRSAFSVGGTPVVGEPGVEEDACVSEDPEKDNKGFQSINELEQLNDFFAKPIWYTVTDGQVDYVLGIRIHAGTQHNSPSRSQRTVSPKDDPKRNYAYPDTRPKDAKHPSRGQISPDHDSGEVANAVAEGIDLEIWTITTSQIAQDVNKRTNGTPLGDLINQVDEDHSTPGIQVSGPGPTNQITGQQTIPTDKVTAIRRVQLTLGVARATATARPAFALPPVGGGGETGGGITPGLPGPIAPPIGNVAPPTAPGGGSTYAVNPFGGPLKLKIDWSSIKFHPWPPYDMAKAIAAAIMLIAVYLLIRRRFRLRRAG